MKEMNDEELQHLAEQSVLINKSLSLKEEQDLVAYQTLFKKLQAEPVEGLPFNFAATVRRTVQLQAERRGDLKFHIILFVTFITVLASAFGLLYLVSPSASEQLLTLSPKFKWSAALGVLVFWSIQFGSQNLTKPKES